MKRIVIFSFFDPDGIADDYIKAYLDGLKPYVSRFVLVCNGHVNDEAKALFEKFTNDVIIRENNGFDVMAWKVGLEQVGWNELASCDEVILANDSAFGPIYPFGEMFDVMSPREDIEFWGIASGSNFPSRNDRVYCVEYGTCDYVPLHIQTYFTVYKKQLLKSIEFQQYWNQINEIQTREDAFRKHEMIQTKYFEDFGYKWDIYAHITDKAVEEINDVYYRPDELLVHCRLPLLKRTCFKTNTLCISDGTSMRRVLQIVRNKTEYDERLIWQNISRLYNQYDVAVALNHTYILSSDYEIKRETLEAGEIKIALFMHLYYPDMFEMAFEHARKMPNNTDIFITTNDQKKVKEIESIFSEFQSRIRVLLIKNRGRSESALLVGLADYAKEYDLVCFWKEKRSEHIEDPYLVNSWADRIDDSLFSSEAYVNNVITLFSDNPYLGMLSPSLPNHGGFVNVLGYEWCENFDNVRNLTKKMGLSVPISEEKPPLAPFGGAFWFRPIAMKKLFEYKWEYDDFPEEPIDIDGTMLHAIERIYSLVCQDAGYYPVHALSTLYAQQDIIALTYYVQGYNKIIRDRDYTFYDYDSATEFFKRELAERDTALKELEVASKELEWRRELSLFEYIKHSIKKHFK